MQFEAERTLDVRWCTVENKKSPSEESPGVFVRAVKSNLSYGTAENNPLTRFSTPTAAPSRRQFSNFCASSDITRERSLPHFLSIFKTIDH